jgi:hypothetical protein
MECKDFETTLIDEGFAPLPTAAQSHLAQCAACSALVEDFSAIASTARELPAEVEPPARVWFRLREQLEQEGIIRGEQIGAAAWWRNWRQIFSGRALATAGVGLVIVLAGALQLRHIRPAAVPASEPFADTASVLDQQEQALTNIQLAGASSAADVTLRENLRSLDQFIAECRERVRQAPDDQLAREYLAGAYQQKAELLAAMMDSGEREH